MIFKNCFLVIRCAEYYEAYPFDDYTYEAMAFSNVDFFKRAKGDDFTIFSSMGKLYVCDISLELFLQLLSKKLVEDTQLEFKKSNVIHAMYNDEPDSDMLCYYYNPVFPIENESTSW